MVIKQQIQQVLDLSVGELTPSRHFKELLADALAEIERLEGELKALDPDPVVCGCREALCPHTPVARLPRQELVNHFREEIRRLTRQRDDLTDRMIAAGLMA